jgi:hypothetical protein
MHMLHAFAAPPLQVKLGKKENLIWLMFRDKMMMECVLSNTPEEFNESRQSAEAI